MACQIHDLATVRKLLSWKPDIDAQDELGRTPLYEACLEGFSEVVEALLLSGADKQKSDRDGDSPLHSLCRIGNLDMIKLLVSKGANKDQVNLKGETPLHIACRCKLKSAADVVQYLLSEGASKERADSKGKTPLYRALESRNDPVARTLKEAGAVTPTLEHCSSYYSNFILDLTKDIRGIPFDKLEASEQKKLRSVITSQNSAGKTILHLACAEGDVEAVPILISWKPDLNIRDKEGQTPLFLSCSNGFSAIVEILLLAGADPNKPDKNGDTPLHVSCRVGFCQTAKLLISHGADQEQVNLSNETPLHFACGNHCATDIVALLLSANVTKDKIDKAGKTPLCSAIEHDNITAAELLLSAGANMYVEDEHGYNVLMKACLLGSVHCVNVLVKAGVNVNKGSGQLTPLTLACDSKNLEILDILIRNGADINYSNANGFNALHMACMDSEALEIVEYLLQAGIEKDKQSIKESWTPLLVACSHNFSAAVHALITAGANKTATDVDGMNGLHIACALGYKDIVEILVNAGFDKGKPDKDGKTPLQTATEKGFTEIVSMLSKEV